MSLLANSVNELTEGATVGAAASFLTATANGTSNDSFNRHYRTAFRSPSRNRQSGDACARGAVDAAMRLRRCDRHNGGESSLGLHSELRVPSRRSRSKEQAQAWVLERRGAHSRNAVISHLGSNEEPLLRPEEQPFLPIRRARDFSLPAMDRGLQSIRNVGAGERLCRSPLDRPHRQRWQLRTGELPMGYDRRASEESLSQARVTGWLLNRIGNVAA